MYNKAWWPFSETRSKEKRQTREQTRHEKPDLYSPDQRVESHQYKNAVPLRGVLDGRYFVSEPNLIQGVGSPQRAVCDPITDTKTHRTHRKLNF